jgi:gliding motility-associated-like protein
MGAFLFKIQLYLTLLCGFTLFAKADHIMGGELQMRPGATTGSYEITLIQYWDGNELILPSPGVNGNRDVTVELFIYRKHDDLFMDRVQLTYLSSMAIQYQNKACASSRSLNTLAGTYKGGIVLSTAKYDDPGGYYIAWERCCRNNDIDNIADPGRTGMVFYLEFPPLAVKNSSPEFSAPNGQYICSNRPFSMNMAATDSDGDELRYSLVTPLSGTTTVNQPLGTSHSKDEYPLIRWERGISASNAIPGSSPLQISNTGLLTVNANTIGLYVFTVQCEEYRNGKQIGLIRRDFQLLVIDCNNGTPDRPIIKLGQAPVSNVQLCPERPVVLQTDESPDWSYQWQLNGQNIPGEVNSTISVSDTGQYSVVKSYTKKCSGDTSSLAVDVGYADPVQAVISFDKDVICEGEQISLFANNGVVDDNLLINWSKDGIVLSEQKTELQIAEPGTYILQVTHAALGCGGEDTTVITKEVFKVSLPEKKGVLKGTKATLSPVVTPLGNSYKYTWSPLTDLETDVNSSVVIVSPSQDTDYAVRVVSENGCFAEAKTLVYVIDRIHIPGSFTPNHDGHNDTFEIFNAHDNIRGIRIYNRWGEIIFHSAGYEKPWDGTYKNEALPAGNYPYFIETELASYRGTVMLLK